MAELLRDGAPGEPAVAVSRGWITSLGLANLAVFAAFYGPLQVLLAQQAQAISPSEKELTLGLVTGVGAFVSMACNPLFGAFSDRTVSRFGRRVPWVVVGGLIAASGMAVLAGARMLALMMLGWALVQAGANASLAAIMASIPDNVPRRQRGVVGGSVALAQTAGAMCGVGLAAATGSWAAGYLACAVFLLVMSAPFVLTSRDPLVSPVERPPFRWGPFLQEFWVRPAEHPDFAWAWITRFLVQVGNALGLVYLYYFLQDAVDHGDPEDGVFKLTAIYSVCSIMTAVVAGRLSDRVGRRKIFVSASGVVMASATITLALFPVWGVVVAAAAVLGLGFGVFISVSYALMTEVLPNAGDAGRHLGVINIAAALPQVIAPLIAAPIVRSVGGYPALYFVAAGVGLLGASLVYRIRGVA